MSTTKHEIFKIPISEDFSFDEEIIRSINVFLEVENYVYINHSVTILTEAIRDYNSYKQINKFLVISLIFKDLTETSYNLKKVTKRTQEIVKKEVKEGESLPMPNYETHFGKK